MKTPQTARKYRGQVVYEAAQIRIAKIVNRCVTSSEVSVPVGASVPLRIHTLGVHLSSMQALSALIWAIILVIASPCLWLRDTHAQHTARTSSSAQQVIPTKGLVEKGVYKNLSIGIEFTPAENLHLQEPEMMGTPGKVPLVITVSALADRTLFSGVFSARDVTVFSADALAYYPEDQRNAARYLKKVIRAQEVDGFKQLDGAASEHISDIEFVRADFVKGAVREAVLVVAHNGYACVFIFAGSDVDAVNKLIASTKVKLAP
jgi:hypothetical protein